MQVRKEVTFKARWRSTGKNTSGGISPWNAWFPRVAGSQLLIPWFSALLPSSKVKHLRLKSWFSPLNRTFESMGMHMHNQMTKPGRWPTQCFTLWQRLTRQMPPELTASCSAQSIGIKGVEHGEYKAAGTCYTLAWWGVSCSQGQVVKDFSAPLHERQNHVLVLITLKLLSQLHENS